MLLVALHWLQQLWFPPLLLKFLMALFEEGKQMNTIKNSIHGLIWNLKTDSYNISRTYLFCAAGMYVEFIVHIYQTHP